MGASFGAGEIFFWGFVIEELGLWMKRSVNRRGSVLSGGLHDGIVEVRSNEDCSLASFHAVSETLNFLNKVAGSRWTLLLLNLG